MLLQADGAPVGASNCHYNPKPPGFLNQRWVVGADKTIKVALDGFCLTAIGKPTSSKGTATAVAVSKCKSGDATQQWETTGAVGPIKNAGKCLTLGSKGVSGSCGAGYPHLILT